MYQTTLPLTRRQVGRNLPGWVVARPQWGDVRNVNVMVADDHVLMRKALVQEVESTSGFSVCCEAESLAMAEQALGDYSPDCLVLNIALQGVYMLDRISGLLKTSPGLKILVVSALGDTIEALHVLRSGAHGFIGQRADPAAFVQALKIVHGGGTYFPAEVASSAKGWLSRIPAGRIRSRQDMLLAGLTRREMEVFRFLGAGMSKAEIAEALQISPRTVDTYRFHIKAILGIASLPDLLRFAVDWLKTNPPPQIFG